MTKTAADILAKALEMGLLTKKDLGQNDEGSDTEEVKDGDIPGEISEIAGWDRKTRSVLRNGVVLDKDKKGKNKKQTGKQKKNPKSVADTKPSLEDQIEALKSSKI